MRQCNTVEDLVQVAYNHLDTISPRGIAAFWSLFVKHLHNHYETSQCKLIEQLNAILYNTLENMSGCGYIDIATIAISLAKIMKQVEFRGQRATTGSLHRFCTIFLLAFTRKRNNSYSTRSPSCHYQFFQSLTLDVYRILSIHLAMQNTYPWSTMDVKSWTFLPLWRCPS